MSSAAETQRSPDGRVFGLDILRSLAVLLVCTGHSIHALYPHYAPLVYLGHGGAIGVELFFVLSGFLIGRILLREQIGGPGNVGRFYLSRWLRTLPLYWLFVGANVVCLVLSTGQSPSAFQILRQASFFHTLGTINMTFMAESWSLAVEEWFYLLLPALIWALVKCRLPFTKAFLTACLILLLLSTGLRAYASLHSAETWNSIRCIVIYRLDAIMFGVLGAWASLSWPQFWRKTRFICALAGLALLVPAYLNLFNSNHESVYEKSFQFSVFDFGFMLLLPLAAQLARPKAAGTSLLTKAITNLALVSYSLYLVHLIWYTIVDKWFGPSTSSLGQGAEVFTIKLGGAILLASLCYHFVEKPLLRLRSRVLPPLKA